MREPPEGSSFGRFLLRVRLRLFLRLALLFLYSDKII